MLSFAFHVLAAFAQVAITRGYYGGGDMLAYFVTGSAIADLVRYSPGQFLPELAALILQQDSLWPFTVVGAGSSTGTMSGISGLIQVVCGESVHAVCLVLSTAAFFGQYALYRVYREVFPVALRMRLLFASMLVPSVIFWSSAILKETVAMAALGWIVLGLHRFVQGRRLLGLAVVLLAGLCVALVKAYILFALSLAAVVWWYWRRALEATGGRGVAVRPLHLVLGVAALLIAIVGLGEIFPRYSLERVGEEADHLRQVGAQVGGGSYFEIAEERNRSLLGQLAYAPLALLTSLYRPMIFEVNNVAMAANALETSALAVLTFLAISRRKLSAIWYQLSRSPSLMFALVFVVAFGIAVGLASTNLGSLSRYRAPLVPFFTALILVWTAPAQRALAKSDDPHIARDQGARAT